MTHEQRPFQPFNPWSRIGWGVTVAVVVVSTAIGFLLLPRFQQNGPVLDTWTAICTALGIYSDSGAAGAPQPQLRTPTRIAWTPEVQAAINGADIHNGAFVALNCTACHGEKGVSRSELIPTLAGMDAAVIYKQLDDYNSGKRPWGVMNGIAAALTEKDRADVAAYFSGIEEGGLPKVGGEGLPAAGRSFRQTDPALRLVFAGDAQRGIPPCSACHGPDALKLGAPVLEGQQAAYIERQLGAFAQGMRQNDINKQMRTIVAGLTAEEMKALASYYGSVRQNRK